MAPNNGQQVTIRLRCIALPGREFDGRSHVRLGIQKGKEVVDDHFADAEELSFTCQLRVAQDGETGKPNFLGPYAQGKPSERFLYLCWGERVTGVWDGFGRVKVHLKELPWPAVANAITAGKPIEAVITMTNQKGKPVYASLAQELITWQV